MTLTPDLAQRHQRAADFHIRRREPDWTGADERELDAWLADPVNQGIFDGFARTALDLRHVRRPPLASDAVIDASNPASRPATPPLGQQRPVPVQPKAPNPWRRALVPAFLCVALLAGGGGWYWWDTQPGDVLDIATGPGETREVALPDGSQVTLNFDSRLRVRYFPRHRDTVLDTGEAFFKVAPDSSRPFIVDSGNSQVRVVGTAFNVRAAPPRFVVKVLEGKVQVRPDRNDRSAPSLLLTAGQGVSIDPATGRHVAVAAPVDAVGDWRTGQLVFQQTPLTEVAAELSRYLHKPVTVDAMPRPLAVSGIVVTESPEPFIRSLPNLLPVQVTRTADGGWHIRAK